MIDRVTVGVGFLDQVAGRIVLIVAVEALQVSGDVAGAVERPGAHAHHHGLDQPVVAIVDQLGFAVGAPARWRSAAGADRSRRGSGPDALRGDIAV